MSAMLFGKLPAHGDFVARGLSPADQAMLDGWLAQEMEAVSTTLGEAFASRFDAAPVWRFVWPQGACAGAIAASTDRVGRRFPLIAAAGVADDEAAAACEERLYSALVEQWSADTLFEAITAIEPSPSDAPIAPDEPSAEARWWSEGNDAFAAGSCRGERPQGLLTAMLTLRESGE